MSERKDPLQYAREVVARDPMALFLNLEVLEVREDYSRLGLTVRDEHLNALDRAHGVIVYALLDQAIAVAANSSGSSAMPLESKINFLNGVPRGTRLEAEARAVEKKRRIGVWSVVVRQQDSGLLVAAGQGTTYHKE